MAPPPSNNQLLLLLLLFLLASAAAVTALDRVPANETFRKVNQGEYGIHINEYDATYRIMDIVTSPFQLMWYNTTPNAYFVALRMGTSFSTSVRRWVWEANRGRPVGENATLTFGKDGDLVLAEADGAVAWSTGTANRGVVGLRLLPNGNIVLHNKKGRFLWQSFDHPTDTLLVGQSLPVGGGKKLVSRRSLADGSPGADSLAMGPSSPILSMILNINNNASPKLPLTYFRYSSGEGYSAMTNGTVTFECYTSDNISYELRLNDRILVVTKYDCTLSFLRLEPDGDLVVYTFDDRVDWGAWEKTFVLFDQKNFLLSACYKPSKCGSLGVCEDEMCVACPTPKGLAGWSRSCAPPERGRCTAAGRRVVVDSAGYYKVVGVENFLARYTEPVIVANVGECRRRCSVDCNCAGFLYWEEASRCWPAPVLGTLDRVPNPNHAVYIKTR